MWYRVPVIAGETGGEGRRRDVNNIRSIVVNFNRILSMPIRTFTPSTAPRMIGSAV